jgi:hypothetical protein
MDVTRYLAAGLALLAVAMGWSSEAAAQFSSTRRPVQAQENCTRAAPCRGPQGGVYFITPSGTRSYISRTEAPRARVQENCTQAAPCIGPSGGHHYITPEGTRRYIRRN